MPSSDDAGSQEALEPVQDTLGWLSRPDWPAALLAILGLGGQIIAFLNAFDAASGQPASPGRARVWAIVGLVLALAVLTLMARLVDEEWLPSAPALGFLGFGAFVGGVLSFLLSSRTLETAGELFLYTATVLIAGTLVVGLLLMAAGIAYTREHRHWRPLLASPLLLYTGAHAVLFTGLLVQGGSVPDAAGLIPLVGL